ncbi:hypothetical protein CEXT_330641 [Caerostris extrusa]|uniref:Uncharacterized protein n=1 Tax=Caerostris extrusa TaxID=172846 RepID=A0AAV4N726_CAEEX|nr:hypothetical protein CEXT_330641 [Caerostris extrusa]
MRLIVGAGEMVGCVRMDPAFLMWNWRPGLPGRGRRPPTGGSKEGRPGSRSALVLEDPIPNRSHFRRPKTLEKTLLRSCWAVQSYVFGSEILKAGIF